MTPYWDAIIVKPSDEVTSSTIVHDENDFFFTTIANRIYEIVLVIAYVSSSGTPDLKLQIGENTNADTGFVVSAGATTTDGGHGTNIKNIRTAITYGAFTSVRTLFLDGSILGFGGVWRVQWAANSAGGTTTIKAGSYMRYRLV
jgi:hypothetical protein